MPEKPYAATTTSHGKIVTITLEDNNPPKVFDPNVATTTSAGSFTPPLSVLEPYRTGPGPLVLGRLSLDGRLIRISGGDEFIFTDQQAIVLRTFASLQKARGSPVHERDVLLFSGVLDAYQNSPGAAGQKEPTFKQVFRSHWAEFTTIAEKLKTARRYWRLID